MMCLVSAVRIWPIFRVQTADRAIILVGFGLLAFPVGIVLKIICAFLLDEDDFKEITNLLFGLETHEVWNLCIQLGLKPSAVKEILKLISDPQKQLEEVILMWLQKKYKYEKHGYPTKRNLVQALVQCNRHDLAGKIDGNQPSMLILAIIIRIYMKKLQGTCQVRHTLFNLMPSLLYTGKKKKKKNYTLSRKI